MKNLNLKTTGAVTLSLLTLSTFAQNWRVGGNTLPQMAGNPSILGTTAGNNNPIRIHTNGIERARFTTGGALNSWLGNVGDGLSIQAPPGTSGNLDLFTSNNAGANETHAVFGNSGQISGQNNRFEFISTGASVGNYYSTFAAGGIHRFDRGQIEYGRLGSNNRWRFGQNTSGPVFGGLNAARMVEVVDNTVQFRLTFSSNSTGPFTDFLSNSAGNLQIMPSGNMVGINLNANPTANMDVNGNVRIRDVQAATPNSLIVGINANGASDVNVRRLDFTGNPNDVLLGNGTWGNTPSGGVGNYCSQTQNPLTGHYEIPFNGFTLNFTDPIGPQAFNTNSVRIGGQCPGPFLSLNSAKLTVIKTPTQNNSTSVVGSLFINNEIANSNPITGLFRGIQSFTTGANRNNYGIYSAVLSAVVNTSGYFEAIQSFNPTDGTNRVNIGVEAHAQNAREQNIAVRAFAANGDGVNYGIFSSAFGTNSLNYAGWFNGDVYVNGAPVLTSDANLKENVNSLSNANAVLKQLTPVTFTFKQNGIYEPMHLSQGVQYGLIAQDVEPILPELIKEAVFPAQYDTLGNMLNAEVNFKTLNYEAFIPMLIASNNELSAEIEAKDSLINDLNTRLTQLENCLSNILPLLCQINNSAIQQNNEQTQSEMRSMMDVLLENKETIVLEQNVPNPFAEQTAIDYTLPGSVQRAQILFYNQEGKLIKAVELTERGQGRINVFGNDLSSGIYTYSLVADGQIIATKRMVKTK